MAALVAAAGFRSSTGALLQPLEQEFGWSRGTTSGAVSLNLIIYGLTAPFAAAVMEHARTTPELSLGVGVLTQAQRDAILVELEGLRRAASPPRARPDPPSSECSSV